MSAHGGRFAADDGGGRVRSRYSSRRWTWVGDVLAAITLSQMAYGLVSGCEGGALPNCHSQSVWSQPLLRELSFGRRHSPEHGAVSMARPLLCPVLLVDLIASNGIK